MPHTTLSFSRLLRLDPVAPGAANTRCARAALLTGSSQRLVDRRVLADAPRPSALAFDEMPCRVANPRPLVATLEQRFQRCREGAGISGREHDPRFAIADQLP